ncbi:MAG: RNA polymerase factor sigma-32 [Polyangiaceae bacterium]|nr:RNA polymerase factor sigma-32 [Polyangiaceae bacterium]
MPTAPARTPHIRAKLSGKRSTALDLERKRTHVLAPFKRIPPVATKKHSSSRSSSRVPRSSPRSSSSGRQSAPASEIIDTEGVADGDEFIDTEGIDTEGIDTEGALNEESLDAESVTDDADSDADSEDPDDDGGELGTAGIDLNAPLVKPQKSSSQSLAVRDPLQAYMREVQRHKLLTREEEHALALRYTEDGDVDAAAQLVTANLRLVVKLAYQYRQAYRNMMDLIQEGNIGLMQAVKRYDPHRGVKLSSYSAWWIRAYMLRYILNNWRLVKLGTTQAQRKLFFNLNKEKAKLAALGVEVTDAEIAQRLDVSEKEVREMDRRLARSDASLDAPVGDTDGRQTSRLELMPSSAAGPDTIVESVELAEMVRERLRDFRTTLSGKDIDIFDKRMIAEDPLTLQQLGDQFGVSRERVRQLEARITRKLREFLKDIDID